MREKNDDQNKISDDKIYGKQKVTRVSHDKAGHGAPQGQAARPYKQVGRPTAGPTSADFRPQLGLLPKLSIFTRVAFRFELN